MSPWVAAGWAAVVLGCLKPIGAHDLFWHLSAGERILSTGSIPRTDWLTGQPWVDFEWLAQLIYAVTARAGGLWALLFLKTALLCAAARQVDLLLAARKAAAAARGAALCALAAVWSMSNEPRPENFTLLLFAWLLRRLDGGELKPGVAAAAFALWANLHAGFVLGLAALAAHGRWRALAAASAGTLINPFGYRVYEVILLHGTSGLGWLVEWRRPDPRNLATWPFYALLAWCAWRVRSLRRSEAVLLALLAFGALRHQRAAVPFSVAAAAYAAPPAAAFAGALWALQPAAWSGPLRRAAFPEKTADLLVGREEKLYNPWGWGGYLGWRDPNLKLFWDGRYLFHDLLPEERAATASPEAWRAFLERRGFELVLLERGQPDVGGQPYWRLFMPPHWELLGEDEASLLFRKLPRRKA